jgi:hypothetical protein
MDRSNVGTFLLIVIGLFVACVARWRLARYRTAELSGLAVQWPASNRPSQERSEQFWRVLLSFNGVNFSARIVVDEVGLTLSPGGFTGLLTRSLCFPWEAVQVSERNERVEVLPAGTAKPIVIRSRSAARSILDHSRQKRPPVPSYRTTSPPVE